MRFIGSKKDYPTTPDDRINATMARDAVERIASEMRGDPTDELAAE